MYGGRLECQLLGAFELRLDGRVLLTGQPKQRAVLAFLALRWNRPAFIDEIIDAVWGESPPKGARNQIHVYVRGLRQMLAGAGQRPSMVVTLADGYRIDLPPGAVDIGAFHQRMSDGRRLARAGQAAGAAEAVEAALSLWRGRRLGGLPGEHFERVATGLEEQRISALEEHMRLQLLLGRHSGLTVTLRAELETHPFHEELRYGLMFALYRCGRTVEALAVYREGRNRTVDEFGIEPGRRLQVLERQIVRNEQVAPPAG